MSDGLSTTTAGPRSGPAIPGAARARLLAITGGLLCLLILSGWLVGHDLLTRLAPGLPSMKVNTALAFLMLSISVWRIGAGRLRWPLFGAVGAMALAALTMLQWFTGVDLSIDNMLLRDLQTPPGDHPGRMAAATSFAVLLLGMAALYAQWPVPQRWRHLPALLALGIAYVASIGLLVGARWPGWAGVAFGSVSLPTATLTLLLGIALLAIDDPAQGPSGAGLPRSRAAVHLVRRCLPVALLLPVLMAWGVELATRTAQMPVETARVLAYSSLGLAYGAMVLGTAAWIAKLEASLRANEASLNARVLLRTEELARAERAAEHARRRLAHVLEHADVGIVAVDANRRVVLFNAAAQRIFGVAAGDIEGQPLDRLIPAELREAHARWVGEFAAHPATPRRMGRPGNAVQGLRADGTSFVLEASIACTDADGDRLMTAVLRDLTIPLALERERRGRELAESASRIKSEQLGQISHELKTPLNAVIGFSSLMLDAPAAAERPPNERRWIMLIRDAGMHMLQVIDDLTELSRVDAGLVRLSIEPVDARGLAESVLELMSGIAAEAGVALGLDPSRDTDPLWVLADKQRLRQVLLNLCSNAIKYNRRDGSVRLVVAARDDGRAVLQVVDSGVGLDSEQLSHLFEPFNRLGREGGAIEGSGLGLVLSRSLVQAMGGRLEVHSVPRQGSTFGVVLALAPLTRAE